MLIASLIKRMNKRMCGPCSDAELGTRLSNMGDSGNLGQNAIPGPSIVGVDIEDGTATFSVQMVDGDGVAVAGVYMVDFSVADTELGVPAAQTSIVVTTGTLIVETVADAAEQVLTDATGLALFTVDAGGADPAIFARASSGGLVTTLELAITA
jgi:hypothetical protein